MSNAAWGWVGVALLVVWLAGCFFYIEKHSATTCTCVDSDECACGGAAGQRQPQQLPQWPWFG